MTEIKNMLKNSWKHIKKYFSMLKLSKFCQWERFELAAVPFLKLLPQDLLSCSFCSEGSFASIPPAHF